MHRCCELCIVANKYASFSVPCYSSRARKLRNTWKQKSNLSDSRNFSSRSLFRYFRKGKAKVLHAVVFFVVLFARFVVANFVVLFRQPLSHLSLRYRCFLSVKLKYQSNIHIPEIY